MGKKIEKLTPEQVARFPEFVKRWVEIGLCTEPANRPLTEEAINEIYETSGLKPPRKIVWCGSPLSQGLTRAIILDNKLVKNIGDSVGASVRDNIRDSIRASVWDSVGDSIRASVRDSVWDSVYGQHDAGWLAFYDYFKRAANLEAQTKKLNGVWKLAQASGWVLPHAEICWVSERHNTLIRDEQGRLHSISGPACTFPDGWAIYAVHGVRVPAHIIEQPEKITTKAIDAESNAEIRRVMIDRYHAGRKVAGAAAYILDAGGERLDHDESFGTLWRRDTLNDEPVVMLEVINSTREPTGEFKHYWLRVDPSCRTAHEASAWTFNTPTKEYTPKIET